MRTFQVICDHCGDEFADDYTVPRRFITVSDETGTPQNIDLCPDCFNAFFSFTLNKVPA